MLKKGSKAYSILKHKCPYCHEGDFFIGKSPYRFKTAGQVHDKCSNCRGKFQLEPGFYYGAMYVAYGLGVGVFVASFIAIYTLFPETETLTYIYWLIGIMVVFGPVFYRLSRIIWANIFMTYGKPVLEKKDQHP